MTIGTEELGKDAIVNVAKTSMSSKLIGPESDYFAQMVVEAMLAVKRTKSNGDVKYPVSAVNVLKAHGGRAKDSRFISGYALPQTVSSQMMAKRIDGAKIACLDFNLMKSKMKMGVQVLISDPEQLEAVRKRESDITKERIEKILAAGANVVLTTQGIDDMCLKYFVEAGAIAVRRVAKHDMRAIARSTGGTLSRIPSHVNTLALTASVSSPFCYPSGLQLCYVPLRSPLEVYSLFSNALHDPGRHGGRGDILSSNAWAR